MSETIEARTAKLAGLQIDFLQKLRSNILSLEEFENFLNMSQKKRQEVFGRKSVDNLLFGEPNLVKQVVLSGDFSLDKNVQPKKEFKYGYVDPNYVRDEYFAQSTLTGLVTLTIAPITRDATNHELVQVANQTDALAVVNALHSMLRVDSKSLDQYKNSAIVIPVSSIKPFAGGNLFCLILNWYDGSWKLSSIGLSARGHAGVCVASVSQ